MQIFSYSAINDYGQKIKGVITALDLENARKNLKSKGLQPIKLQKKNYSYFSGSKSNTWVTDWSSDLGFFLRQELALIDSLHASKLRLSTQQKQLVDLIIEGVYSGLPLSQVLDVYGHFPKLLSGLLQVAETTGQYAQAFEDYAALRREEQQFFKQLRLSLQYPLILVFVILGMILGFSEFLLPSALQFFNENNFEQQIFTKFFIAFAEILRGFFSMFVDWQFWVITLLAIFGFSKIPRARYYFGLIAVTIPFFGSTYLQTVQAIYLKSFSTMLSRGHHVLLAASCSSEILQNSFLKTQAEKIMHSIKQEGKISLSIGKFLRLPATLTNLILTGEQTAQLGAYCNICAEVLKNQSRQRLQAVLSWTGPLLVFIMGIVMIWMVVAIVVPLYDQVTKMD